MYSVHFSSEEDAMKCLNFMKEQIEIRGCVTLYFLHKMIGEKYTKDEREMGWTDISNATIFVHTPSTTCTLRLSDPVGLKSETGNNDNVVRHAAICKELTDLYERKNHDYGDAFHDTFLEEGFAMARIRLTDKLKRFKTLSKNSEGMVKDESIRDTLIDLANYAIMTVMEIDRDG